MYRKPQIHFTAIRGEPDVVTKWTEGCYDVDGTTWVPSTSEQVPTELAKLKGKKVIGWKKCGWYDKRLKVRRHAMVKLEIAANTQRVQPKNYKCRAASAKVLMIFECVPGKGKRYNHWKLTGKNLRRAVSYYNSEFVYRVGERVKPLPADEPAWVSAGKKTRRRLIAGSTKFVRNSSECAPGIHFFLTQYQAQRYAL